MSEPSTAESPALPEEPVRFPVGTLVFGLVLVLVGALLLVSLLTGFTFNPGMLAICVLVAAGLVLVIGGIAASRRHR
ncbi:hypothetical protein [Paeniglutamicibacter cryotolerans]|uniref:Putative phage tail protein n=1 Tax=Paeniglutamicibacter cryotolerans TaxID=670079 RepID=A0A839QDL0_9MICC|nr:hypothetical protein [Paeniglutamicibacter cryotolerans]MBB2993990.1 putative phage tail protein [Paeniglutamicibacter cryotolerans]